MKERNAGSKWEGAIPKKRARGQKREGNGICLEKTIRENEKSMHDVMKGIIPAYVWCCTGY